MSTPLTLLVHLKNGPINAKATTQRTNFPFNSFCKFNGEYLAASTTVGLCKLGGNLDIATPIDAYFIPIHYDFENSNIKHLRTLYFSGDFDGQMRLTLSADDGTEQSYSFATLTTGKQLAKKKVSSSTRGVYHKIKVENYNGCDFSLNRIEVFPIFTNKL